MCRPLIAKLGAVGALALSLWWTLPVGFFNAPWLLSHDTITYTNEPGISKGISLNNFSDSLRTPGYPLFFFVVTLGAIPSPDTITKAACGNGILSQSANCAAATVSLHADVTVNAPPFVYGYSRQTDQRFQRAIVVSRSLFVLSLVVLCLALSDRLGLLAAVCVAPLPYFMGLGQTHFLDVLATESLFPSVLFFYVAAMLRYAGSRRDVWLLLSTLLALYVALLRPAFVYLPILHVVVVATFTMPRKAWGALAVTLSLTVATFVWWAWLSPIEFFSVANKSSELLRVAVISDQTTIDCISDPAEKALLAAYLDSIADESTVTPADGAMKYYVQRYFALAMRDAFRIDVAEHPIYKQPGITALLQGTTIPPALIDGMLASARACNQGKSLKYTAINVAMMLGLTPELTPHAPRYFFQRVRVFLVSAVLILTGFALAAVRRDPWWLLAILLPAAIYFAMVLIIALKQGGEARYSYPVEPLFVLSTAAALGYLLTAWDLTRWRANAC